jgi:hypothetical protein
MPASPQWSLSLRFPHQNPIHASLLPHPRYMPRPSRSRFYHLHNIGWGVQIMNHVQANTKNKGAVQLVHTVGLL